MTPAPIIPIKVVIVFYSRYGESERAALAAGVGAIQARAVITGHVRMGKPNTFN